jgi:hypothetical protein
MLRREGSGDDAGNIPAGEISVIPVASMPKTPFRCPEPPAEVTAISSQSSRRVRYYPSTEPRIRHFDYVVVELRRVEVEISHAYPKWHGISKRNLSQHGQLIILHNNIGSKMLSIVILYAAPLHLHFLLHRI